MLVCMCVNVGTVEANMNNKFGYIISPFASGFVANKCCAWYECELCHIPAASSLFATYCDHLYQKGYVSCHL